MTETEKIKELTKTLNEIIDKACFARDDFLLKKLDDLDVSTILNDIACNASDCIVKISNQE